jgi:hypothetical protein
MKICICMITIDRSEFGQENYFDRTMTSFDRSGLWTSDNPFEFHVFDGGSENESFIGKWVFEPIRIHSSSWRIPVNVNFGRALLSCLDHDCDWVFMCEDDIEVCKDFLDGAVEWIEKNARDMFRVITFYTPYVEIKKFYSVGPYWSYPVKAFYGTQCLALRKSDAASAGAYIMADTKFSPGAYDLILKEWHKEKYPENGFMQATIPCFAEHVGEGSVINPGRYHKSGLFLGESWSPIQQVI